MMQVTEADLVLADWFYGQGERLVVHYLPQDIAERLARHREQAVQEAVAGIVAWMQAQYMVDGIIEMPAEQMIAAIEQGEWK